MFCTSPRTKGECFLFNKTFTGRIHTPGKCEMWSCYPESRTVVVVRCGKLPYGCYSLGGPDLPLPKCCSTYCDPYMFTCLTPENKLLLNNQEYNSTNPCVRYSCQKGALVTITCLGYGDTSCSASNINPYLPFPACCGVGKVCPR
nr:uncharacterized protein LOC126539185 isoform X3 [Dermacentor andersoni]